MSGDLLGYQPAWTVRQGLARSVAWYEAGAARLEVTAPPASLG